MCDFFLTYDPYACGAQKSGRQIAAPTSPILFFVVGLEPTVRLQQRFNFAALTTAHFTLLRHRLRTPCIRRKAAVVLGPLRPLRGSQVRRFESATKQ